MVQFRYLYEYFFDVVPEVLGVQTPGGLLADGAAGGGIRGPGHRVNLQALRTGQQFVKEPLGGWQDLLRQL